MRKRVKHALLVLLLLPYALTLLYLFVPPPSTLMLARFIQRKPVDRQWVKLARISPHLLAAVVSSEDDAFCDHFGFDFRQMQKSIKYASANHQPIQATSTITMQTAKNLFLWNGRSWTRKLLEAPLTLWLEMVWTKRRILEVYLNIAEWGDGISAAALSPHQAALLAASLPNPIQRAAGKPGVDQSLRAAAIERRMAVDGPVLSCVR